MTSSDETITYFAETDFRGKKTKFGIRKLDRARHMYVIGKTGMGKSTMLENMAIQDIQNGEGVAFIDPHGTTAEKLLQYVPEHRIKDVVYFAPWDLEHPVSFNVMEDVGKDQRHLVANGLMASFKKIWPDVWSARMEYILNNIILALLEYPDSTLLGVNRMLSDKDFRNAVVANITDPSVRAFWVDEFAKYTDKFMTEAGAAIQNKIGQFTSNPLIRNIVGQPKASLDVRKVMDEKKILIMNLSKGRMGEINANLIGGMLITKIYLAAMSRASASPAEMRVLPELYFYVDEFQSFVNDSFKDILSEARKYKLCLTIAHQYIEQMPEEVRNAVFGNVGTTIAFRVGPFDAEVLEKVFAPNFMATDIVNLGFAQIYLTLMINGVGSPPFSAKTIDPIPEPAVSFVPQIMEFSRATYARPRAIVEEAVRKWHEPMLPPPRRELPPRVGVPTPPGRDLRHDLPLPQSQPSPASNNPSSPSAFRPGPAQTPVSSGPRETRKPAFYRQGDAPVSSQPPRSTSFQAAPLNPLSRPDLRSDASRNSRPAPRSASTPAPIQNNTPVREDRSAPQRDVRQDARPAAPVRPVSLSSLAPSAQPMEKGKSSLKEALALALAEQERVKKEKESAPQTPAAKPAFAPNTSRERAVSTPPRPAATQAAIASTPVSPSVSSSLGPDEIKRMLEVPREVPRSEE